MAKFKERKLPSGFVKRLSALPNVENTIIMIEVMFSGSYDLIGFEMMLSYLYVSNRLLIILHFLKIYLIFLIYSDKF